MLLGKLIVLLSTAISYLIWPLTWLRDQIQASSRPVWTDFATTAAIVSDPAVRPQRRHSHRMAFAHRQPCGSFAGIGIVIAVMGFDRRRIADCRYPALGRSSGDAGGFGHRHRRLDAGRHCARPGPTLDDTADPDFPVAFIEFWRGVPLITGAVFRNLHAAAVRSGGLHDGWAGAGLDRHRAVCRRLSGRK